MMGSQDSKSSSAPVDAATRLDTYNKGTQAIQSDTSNYGGEGYNAPVYERLGEGDYRRVSEGLNAGTTRQQQLALEANDQAMADRGIYSSLNALRSNASVREGYAPQFAANDAAVVQMKAQDIAGANAAAQDAAKQKYEASWRPADYKAGLWNGTGGVISSGSSGGWSI
jgi:hypothetical protein